jgi:nitrite reductase/ring-hydroxylating ferredoxin subunit/uncharacterized membrane protein
VAGKALIEAIEQQDFLDKSSEAIQPAVSNVFKAAGSSGQEVKNFLHGTWLGHPLHPPLTDVPLGAWTTALALDAVKAVTGRREFGRGADIAVAVGVVGAVAAAVTGVTDWSATNGRARKMGLAHGLLNLSATCLYITSMLLRPRKKFRRAGIRFSLLGYLVSGFAAYIGGHLVYGEKIGVNHAAQDLPKEFVPVLPEAELHEGGMKSADANGTQVCVVRRGGKIYALANLCSHLGGPLSEGILEGDIVGCPWHGSRFSICDGKVVDGPATFPQPKLETRIWNGQIEVRAPRG